MKQGDWRYMAVALLPSIGAFFALSILIHPFVGTAYLAVFYVTLTRRPWLHKAIHRIAYGKEEKA